MKQMERKRRKGKKRHFWYVLGFILICAYASFAYMAKPTYKPITQEVGIEHQDVSIRWPSSGAASVASSDYDDSLASIRGDTQIPSASTIKLLTALVVLEQKPLGPNEAGEAIYFGAPDVERFNEVVSRGGAALAIPVDTTITYREALDALLVESANNIADKLSIWAFGTTEAYLKAAKVYTVTHGLNQTVVSDASGLLSDTKTSSIDMAIIAKLASESPVIASITRQQTVSLSDGRLLTNTNDLLGIDGVNGLKTGNTSEAGYCLVASKLVRVFDRDKTVIATVFGQSSREAANQAALTLLEDAVKGYEVTNVVNKNQAVAYYESPWGKRVEVRPKGDVSILRWKGVGISATFDLQTISTAKQGDVVGNLVMGRENFPLVLNEDLPGASIWWHMTHAFDWIKIPS